MAEAEETAVYTLGDHFVNLDGDSSQGRLQRKEQHLKSGKGIAGSNHEIESMYARMYNP
jgi:hypothetical protein